MRGYEITAAVNAESPSAIASITTSAAARNNVRRRVRGISWKPAGGLAQLRPFSYISNEGNSPKLSLRALFVGDVLKGQFTTD
jgi:hypothetical protein